MRSSTRKAERARLPLLVLTLMLAACSTATGARAPAPAEDHRTDAGEKHRTMVFATDDHSLDVVERNRGDAFSDR